MKEIAQKIRAKIAEAATARASEVERHRRALDEFDQKIADFEAALRAIAEIEAEDTIDQAVEEIITTSSSRPADLPSMPEMIKNMLGTNRAPLEPKELLNRIRAVYWEGFESGDVGSTAWRMWKRGELNKAGAAYSLPDTNEAPQEVASPDGASKAEEAETLF